MISTDVRGRGTGSADALAFAQRRGYTVAQTEEERRLPLPVPDAAWDRLAAQAAPHHAEYRLQVVQGAVPADLAQSYCDTYNQLHALAPTGDLDITATARTPALLAARWEQIRSGGGDQVVGLALDTRGDVVGLCNVITNAGDTHLAQGSTVVSPDHWGHRLGLALKVAAYRAAQHAFPERTYVVTWNAADNAPMIAVNEAMGFALHGTTVTLQKRL